MRKLIFSDGFFYVGNSFEVLFGMYNLDENRKKMRKKIERKCPALTKFSRKVGYSN